MAKMLKLTPKRMAEGLAHLAAVDPDLARALQECGAPPMRTSDPGFTTLLRSIMGQQVSVHAARSIWEKLNRLVSPLTPENMMLASDATLREAGLSGQKARYAKALAADIVEKRLDFDGVHLMEDETAIAELTKALGVGRWTAEIYLMFALGRTDIMPGNDLGLITAAHHLKGLRRRPDEKKLRRIAEQWKPWRSVASLVLWHYRHNMPDWSEPGKKKAAKPKTKTATGKKTAVKKVAKKKAKKK
jgi:DNA-3-methyladenine glycosylase II